MKKKDRIRILESEVADLRRRLEQQQLEINTLKWPRPNNPLYPPNQWEWQWPLYKVWCQTSSDSTAPAARSDA